MINRNRQYSKAAKRNLIRAAFERGKALQALFIRCRRGRKAWEAWLQENVQLSKTMADRHRTLYLCLGRYPAFQYLGVAVWLLMYHARSIEYYLEEDTEFAKFWKEPQLTSQMVQDCLQSLGSSRCK